MSTTATLRQITKEAEGLATAIAAASLLRMLPVDPEAERHRVQLMAAMGWKCAIDDCPRQSRAVGLCDSHYRGLRNLRATA